MTEMSDVPMMSHRQRYDDTNSATDTDDFLHGYDRNGNRLYKDNAQGDGSYNSFDELYHADGSSAGYDSLDRLTEFQRGTLTGTDTITSESRRQAGAKQRGRG
jgi:hypothetical protein